MSTNIERFFHEIKKNETQDVITRKIKSAPPQFKMKAFGTTSNIASTIYIGEKHVLVSVHPFYVKREIKKTHEQHNYPYSYLITFTRNVNAVLRVDSSGFGSISNMSLISYAEVFSVGQDCKVTLERIIYKAYKDQPKFISRYICLLCIITFGTEIDEINWTDHFEDMITHHIISSPEYELQVLSRSA